MLRQRAESMAGATRGDVGRMHANDAHITLIVPSDRHSEIEMILHRVVLGKSLENFETVRRSKQGRLINVSLTVSPTPARLELRFLSVPHGRQATSRG